MKKAIFSTVLSAMISFGLAGYLPATSLDDYSHIFMIAGLILLFGGNCLALSLIWRDEDK